jgi:molybdopterin synthase catalytic subunit
MTEKALAAIVGEAGSAGSSSTPGHPPRRPLLPTDQIVLVAVAAAHRGEAFAACEFIMDYLKTRAPFWKREVTPARCALGRARASDDQAAERWRASATALPSRTVSDLPP